jgi:Unconventional myosin tail, actin- and lipid-binding
MYKINSTLSKTKRILIITAENLYSVNLNLTLARRIPLGLIAKMTIIRNSSAILVIHPVGGKDFLLESMKRTELIMFLVNQCDNLKIARPQITQSQGLRLM